MALSKFSEAKTLCLRLTIIVNEYVPSHQEHANTLQTLYKLWSDNGMMMLGRNIIEQHYKNDGVTMT